MSGWRRAAVRCRRSWQNQRFRLRVESPLVAGVVVRSGLGLQWVYRGGLIYLGDVPTPFSSAPVLRIQILQIGVGSGCVGVEGRCGIVGFLRLFFRLLLWRLHALGCGDIG